jgi:hypothetical protein
VPPLIRSRRGAKRKIDLEEIELELVETARKLMDIALDAEVMRQSIYNRRYRDKKRRL